MFLDPPQFAFSGLDCVPRHDLFAELPTWILWLNLSRPKTSRANISCNHNRFFGRNDHVGYFFRHRFRIESHSRY